MKRRTCLLVIALLLPPCTLLAEVEVTLKSGASLVGKVKIDGADAVVTIDGAEMRVPLSEVDTIAAADAGPERQAHRLLLTALGARTAKDDGIEVIGLLAEASRLAPDDPHIAYWYATSLADAGYGQAANDILTKQRDAISEAYPGMIDQLAGRIKRRMEMERMPPALIERVDALNEQLAKQSANAEQRELAVLFRLVDQEEMPIEQSAFHIQSSGHDQHTESFDDGFFVYMYKQHRGNNDQPCHLEVMRPGLEAKTFDFSGASNRVQDAGKLVVRRYEEDAKKPFRIAVSDSTGKPIAGAQVSLNPTSSRGNSSNQSLTGDTDGEGRAEIMAFPMKYSYRVTSEGFNPAGGNIEIRSDGSEPSEQKLQLFRAVQATVRVAWESTSPQGGGRNSGDATLTIGGGAGQPQPYGPQNETAWIRPIQQKDRLTLQFVDSPFGFGGPFAAPEAWVRVIETEAEAAEAEPEGESKTDKKKPSGLDEFNALDLGKVDELKSKLPQPRMLGGGQQTGPRPPMVLAAEAGKIFVGRVQHRDMRTGQPVQLTFKVYVEELSTGEEGAE